MLPKFFHLLMIVNDRDSKVFTWIKAKFIKTTNQIKKPTKNQIKPAL
jgi:hypothetical protein